MFRTFFSLALGAATVAGGIYLYKKYGRGRRKEIVAQITGVVLGDKLGGITGYAVGGPAGAIVGSVVGALTGSVVTEQYFLESGRDFSN